MSLEFMEKFKPSRFLLKDFKYWLICLRRDQVTLGDAVFLLKRETPNFANLTKEEAAELSEVYSWYENKINSVFQAERFNYVAAMMRDNYVHIHAFPRYSCDKQCLGVEWKDEDWPRVINFRKTEISDDVYDGLIDLLKE